MCKIRNFTLVFAILFVFLTSLFAQGLSFDGVYTGKNMVISNPKAGDFFGTCIDRISINGELYPFNISDNILEIDFKRIGLKKNDLFYLTISHSQNCQPIIYNQSDFFPATQAKIEQLKFQDNKLFWIVESEVHLGNFQLELFYRNRWVEIDQITSNGIGKNQYSYSIGSHLTGVNKYRIKKINSDEYYYFPTFSTSISPYSLSNTTVSKTISILQNQQKVQAYYELEDLLGNLIKKGRSETIDFSSLKAGYYYLYVDQKKHLIIKK